MASSDHALGDVAPTPGPLKPRIVPPPRPTLPAVPAATKPPAKAAAPARTAHKKAAAMGVPKADALPPVVVKAVGLLKAHLTQADARLVERLARIEALLVHMEAREAGWTAPASILNFMEGYVSA